MFILPDTNGAIASPFPYLNIRELPDSDELYKEGYSTPLYIVVCRGVQHVR